MILLRRRRGRLPGDRVRGGFRPWAPGDEAAEGRTTLLLLWVLATAATVLILDVVPGGLPGAGAGAEGGARRLLGTAGAIGAGHALVALYLARLHPEVLRSTRRLALAMLLGLGTLAAARLLEAAPPAPFRLVLHTPAVLATCVVAIAMGPRFAAESAALLLYDLAVAWRAPGIGAPGGVATDLEALAVLGAGCGVAVLGARRVRNRARLVKVGLAAGALAGLVHLALHPPAALPGGLADAGALLAHGLLLGFLVSGALPFIEALADVVTDISLLELSDQNHPLLRRLLLEAPGTYHHSVVVGSLAEAGAEAIGANALLARVGAYYHDVGKSMKPEYFTENEGKKGLRHGRLSPTLSTLVIKAHTKDGVVLAREYDLPQAIVDFIPQHHGTSVIEFFYQEAVSLEGDSSVPRDAFRHDGPKPQVKETAIMHLADSVEAASRSLSDPTPGRLRDLVHTIIWKKLGDGQLDECDLTFRELRRIEEAFVRVLVGVFHSRIRYPDARPGARAR
ncbi:MAG: HDIG domain-containing protein [Planctomycetales bacterium]|nr:HDIG domain-containing protein [Planctomycetales bacterium]